MGWAGEGPCTLACGWCRSVGQVGACRPGRAVGGLSTQRGTSGHHWQAIRARIRVVTGPKPALSHRPAQRCRRTGVCRRTRRGPVRRGCRRGACHSDGPLVACPSCRQVWKGTAALVLLEEVPIERSYDLGPRSGVARMEPQGRTARYVNVTGSSHDRSTECSRMLVHREMIHRTYRAQGRVRSDRAQDKRKTCGFSRRLLIRRLSCFRRCKQSGRGGDAGLAFEGEAQQAS